MLWSVPGRAALRWPTNDVVTLVTSAPDYAGVVVYNEGNMKKNILIGHPTLGSIRYEWHVHRGQIIPINWQSGQIASNHLPDPIAAGVIFRGRGNGAFLNFRIGDRVWCDGIPTGFLDRGDVRSRTDSHPAPFWTNLGARSRGRIPRRASASPG